jgi:hypothetical protein
MTMTLKSQAEQLTFQWETTATSDDILRALRIDQASTEAHIQVWPNPKYAAIVRFLFGDDPHQAIGTWQIRDAAEASALSTELEIQAAERFAWAHEFPHKR